MQQPLGEFCPLTNAKMSEHGARIINIPSLSILGKVKAEPGDILRANC